MYDWVPDVCDDSSQVVTASRRLARLLTVEYNQRQIAGGKDAWLTPVILAWPDWLSRLLASGEPTRQPARLSSHQSRVLWEIVLREVIDDPLVNIPTLTRHARDAWKSLHEWQVPFEECVSAASSRDQRVFADAASRYRDRLAAQDWIDEAMLGARVTAAIRAGALPAPHRVVLAGFDRTTPEVDRLLDALRAAGTTVEVAAVAAAGRDTRLVACDDPDAELRSAGAWACEQLREHQGRHVAIVVSGLEQDAERAGRLVREGAGNMRLAPSTPR
jgi:hypothetical protein